MDTSGAYRTTEKQLETLLRQGYGALETEQWQEAETCFEAAAAVNAGSAEAFFGRALARQRCASVDALQRRRQSGGQLHPVRRTACQEDRARIDAAVARCRVPGYLEERDLRRLFEAYDRTYPSVTDAWRKRVNEEELYWTRDPMLSQALRLADGDLALTLRTVRNAVNSALWEELELSEQRDWERSEKTKAGYAAHLEAAEREASARCAEAMQRREADYAVACLAQSGAATVEDYRYAAGRFERVGDFEDAPERARACDAMADRIDADEARRIQIKKELPALRGLFHAHRRRKLERELEALNRRLGDTEPGPAEADPEQKEEPI